MENNNQEFNPRFSQYDAAYLLSLGYQVDISRVNGNYVRFSTNDNDMAIRDIDELKENELLGNYISSLKELKKRMRDLPRYAPKSKEAEPAAAEPPENNCE